MSFWKKKEQEITENIEVPEKIIIKENNKNSDLIEQRFGKVQSALGAGTVITGKLSFDTPVRIDGKLNGEIFSADTLIIGATAEIKANINVQNLVVLGQFEGEANIRGGLELLKNSKFSGNVVVKTLKIDDGAQFNAIVKMSK